MRPVAAWLVAAAAVWGTPPPLRDQISLNGNWAQGGTVPLYTGNRLRTQTYARQVSVPDSWAGKIIKVEFTAVNYNADVYVNDRLAASHVGPWNPFAVEVSNLVKPGEVFTLRVEVKGMLHPPIVDERGLARWPVGTSRLGDKLAGIVDDVWLRAYGPVHVTDAFVRPSFRERRLRVDYEVVNAEHHPRTVRVEAAAMRADSGGVEKRFSALNLSLRAGETRCATLDVPWTRPALWWPDRPVLYHLVTKVIDGGRVLDRETRRFGFREIWTGGNRLYLNGVRLNLWGDYAAYGETAYWPERCYTPEGWPATVDALKSLNIRVLRWHERPSPQYTLDVSDEKGLMIVAESAVEHLNTIDHGTFIEGCDRFLQSWVRANRNHPSILIWSAENGMGPGGFKVLSPSELLPLRESIRKQDVTRPVSYDGDGEIGGGDLICYHEMTPVSGLIYRWSKPVSPDKPTGASEIIPVLHYFRKPPEVLESNKLAQGILARGLRYAGYADIRPSVYTWAWREMDGPRAAALGNGYAPVALFDKEYDNLGIEPVEQRVYPILEAGAHVERRLVLYNDDFRDRTLTAEASVEAGGRIFAAAAKRFEVTPGERIELNCAFGVPGAGEPEIDLVLRVRKAGVLRFEEALRSV